VLVASEDDALLEQFDAASLTPLGALRLPARPHNVAVAPDGCAAWLTSPSEGRVLVVGLPELALRSSIDVKDRPHDLAFTPDGRELWLTLWGSSEVLVLAAPTARPEVGRPPAACPTTSR
jgi:DNA-binding beta-propeller fold protein YncE